jgi:hypothetical protein
MGYYVENMTDYTGILSFGSRLDVYIHYITENEREYDGMDGNTKISWTSSGCVRDISENISEQFLD